MIVLLVAFIPVSQAQAPAVPTGLRSTVNGNVVSVGWDAVGLAVNYRIQVGTSTGASNLFDGIIGNVTNAQGTVPPGAYFWRVIAIAPSGLQSAPSVEAQFAVGGCAPPGAPQELTHTVDGSLVTLRWSPPLAGGLPATYVIEAGTRSGLSNLYNAPTGSIATDIAVSAPRGTYFVRLRSRNDCGVSDVSNERTIVVSAPQPPLIWTKTGGPLGGLGYDVRLRRDNPNVVFVTDAFSGVNVSRDGGETWSASNTGITARAGPSLDAVPVFSLTIDPQNTNVMWAGTQNVRGIFRSTDGGQSWTRKDNGVVEGAGLTIRGFTVDPLDSRIVYAAGEVASATWAGQPRNGREFDLTRGVVYKTSDRGETWAAIWRGNNLARHVWIHPTNPNLLYVSTGIFDREAANTDVASAASGGVGVLKTTDGGRTWRELNRGNGLANLYIGSLFMHPTDPNILLAGAGNNAWREGSGVYLSIDGGETWRQTLSSRLNAITSVEFSLSQPNVAYAGSEIAFYRSDDGGRTWGELTKPIEGGWGPPGIRAGFPIDLQVDYRDPRRVFANNYGGGNFLSTDGGQTWRDASRGYTGAQITTLAVDRSDPATVYVGGRSSFFKSADGGAFWHPISPPTSEAAAVAISPIDRQQVIASDPFTGRLWSSRDGGRTWRTAVDYGTALSQLHPNDTNARHQGFAAIAFAPSDPRIVYAGFAVRFCAGPNDPQYCQVPTLVGVHVSFDGGTNWQPLADGGLQSRSVLSIAVHPLSPDVVYAATAGGGVMKSTNGGRTWSSSNEGLPTRNVRCLAIDARAPDTVYLGTEDAALFKSSDGGATWRPANVGLDPTAPIRAIVIDPTDSSVLWVADLRSGVYRSSDAGANWTPVNTGLTTRAVRALAISSNGQTVYAGTDGEGVFRLGRGQ